MPYVRCNCSVLDARFGPAPPSCKAVDLDVGADWLIREWASSKGDFIVGFETERVGTVGYA